MTDAAESDAPPPKRKKGIYVGAPACFHLQLACQELNRSFGGFGDYALAIPRLIL